MDRSLVETLVNWFPMLLLVGVWIYFMWQMRNGRLSRYQIDCYDLAKRQAEALERIAAVLEKTR